MRSKNKKPWEEQWEHVDELDQGGQGIVTLVRARGNTSAPLHVLKRLKRQDDPERRARMYREVAAMETLRHPGIPRLVTSNAVEFAQLDIPLFMVQERIDGITLSKRVERGVLNATDALRLLSRLVEIVKYCHSRDIGHRDIKPDNIILRAGLVTDPVLVDFGLSFNSSDDLHLLTTPSLQQLGNRFYALPELQLRGGDKRDKRSDITMLIAVLFYCVTGEHPGSPLDDQSRKPHQRPRALKAFETIDPIFQSGLRRIFDRGFEVIINNRYQTLEAIEKDVFDTLNTTNSNAFSVSPQAIFTELRSTAIDNPSNARAIQIRTMFEEWDKVLYAAVEQIRIQLNEVFSQYQTGYKIDLPALRYENTLGFINVFNHKEVRFEFSVYVSGIELIVDCIFDKQTTELARITLQGSMQGVLAPLEGTLLRYMAPRLSAIS